MEDEDIDCANTRQEQELVMNKGFYDSINQLIIALEYLTNNHNEFGDRVVQAIDLVNKFVILHENDLKHHSLLHTEVIGKIRELCANEHFPFCNVDS